MTRRVRDGEAREEGMMEEEAAAPLERMSEDAGWEERALELALSACDREDEEEEELMPTCSGEVLNLPPDNCDA